MLTYRLIDISSFKLLLDGLNLSFSKTKVHGNVQHFVDFLF